MQKLWRRIRKLADLPDAPIHDLRYTFASSGVALGLPIIGRLLGLTQPQKIRTLRICPPCPRSQRSIKSHETYRLRSNSCSQPSRSGAGNFENCINFDRYSHWKLADANSRAGVFAMIAKHFNHQIRSAVCHFGLISESCG